MNVLHLSGAMIWGGNEQQVVTMISSMETMPEAEVTNFICCFIGSPMEEYAKRHGINHIALEKRKTFSLRTAKALRKIVTDHQIDVIHIHTSNFVTIYMIADLLGTMDVAVVFSKKGISDKSTSLSALKYNYKGIDKVICVSKAVEHAFRNVLKPEHHHKLTVIYDGIDVRENDKGVQRDLREEFSIGKSKFLVGNIANHSQAKDLATLMKTANHLVNELGQKDFHFIQIGEKLKYTEEFIGLVEEYGLEDHITFTGKIANAAALMSQFDTFLITSKSEGLPLTIYEAFLHKVPVVTTNAGGIPEAVSNEVNGLVAAVGDYKALAAGILRVKEDEALRSRFVEKSNQRVYADFDSRKCAAQTIDLYRSILENAN